MALLRITSLSRTLFTSIPLSTKPTLSSSALTCLSSNFDRPSLQLRPRFSFTIQSSRQGIHSQSMADTSDTVPSIVVYVTVPNKEEGRKIALSIIKERLAACVNQVPGIESTYWWNDKVETDSEELLIIKTRQSLLEALTAHVKKVHPYESSIRTFTTIKRVWLLIIVFDGQDVRSCCFTYFGRKP